MHVSVYMNVCMSVCVDECMHTCILAHMHTGTYAFIHTYIMSCSLMSYHGMPCHVISCLVSM